MREGPPFSPASSFSSSSPFFPPLPSTNPGPFLPEAAAGLAARLFMLDLDKERSLVGCLLDCLSESSGLSLQKRQTGGELGELLSSRQL